MNKFIDHTLLKATATTKEIEQLCKEALEYDFASVCVNPAYVELAASILMDSDVAVCTVVGFPLGSNTIETKQMETMDAIQHGATEIDMVINIGKAKDHNYDYILEEIKAVVQAAAGRLIKVIIETCYLTEDEKVEVCKMAALAGAQFVKTSTGFGTGGATIHDIELMKQTVLPEMSVKASGGVRDLASAKAMIEAGANRIGTSNGITIMNELNKKVSVNNHVNSSY